MNFKLTNKEVLNQMYGQSISLLGDKKWEVGGLRCGCSGDYGSNWMRS